ncbi:MAG: hypothetical protein PHI32_07965 [Dysgonamonadaceae bacterium]|nr:hypothetical protein [Dysgonamonadaceae bacterium]
MKRIGKLYDKIISLDNLYEADSVARKGKLRSYGVKIHDRNKHERSIASYWGWCKHCDSINLTEKLFKNTEYENKFRR